MKIKKTSLCAIGMAAMLVAGVTAAFATTAATARADTRQFSAIPGTDYTEAEYRMLLALKFDGYEDMTISQYREKTFAITDTKSYMDLLERMEQDEQAEALKDENETAAFLYDCFFPLTAERWKVRTFGGCCDVKSESTSDRAVLEYSLSLIIWDKDTLKVGDYLTARKGISAELDRWMQERSQEELRDEEKMLALLDEEVESIYRRWDTDSLGINLETSFMPLTGYDTGIDASGNGAEDWLGSLAGYESELAEEEARLQAQAREERLAQYAEILAPYLPFDLTYLYDKAADRIRMYYQGEEVRGLVDEEQGYWITESAGLDSYPEDAAELYAVYENGVLAGLRKATEQEQAEYTRTRRENSELRKRLDAEIQENFGDKAETQGEPGKAERPAASDSEPQDQGELRGEPGTAEDYASLFALMTPGYKESSVADFNLRLLEWTNDNFDRMERISMDTGWNDFQVPMDEEELAFVMQTVFLSGMENGAKVQGSYTGRQEDPVYDRYLPEKSVWTEGAAWCDLYYQCSWHITDQEKVTVGQRDACVAAMMKGVEDFWQETDFEALLKMEKEDVAEALQEIAAECSNETISLSVRTDHVSFEKMDERGMEFD